MFLKKSKFIILNYIKISSDMNKILILLVILVLLGLSSCSSTASLLLVNHGQGSWDKNRGHRPLPNKKFKNNHLSCGDLNSKFKVCCSGVVQGKKGSASACCGYHSYDADKDICCHGLIQRKSRFNLNCNNNERG